jgi:hypothetical protein
MSLHLYPIFESFPDIHSQYNAFLSEGYEADKGASWKRDMSGKVEFAAITFRKESQVIRLWQELYLDTGEYSELVFEQLKG